MQEKTESLRLLLISPTEARAGQLSRMLQQHKLKTVLNVMQPTAEAVSCLRRTGRFRFSGPIDVLLIDVANCNQDELAMLADLAFGPNRVPTPTVLLTDESAEAALDSGQLPTGDSIMFAPTSLPSFLNKMRQHSQQKFLHALSRLSGIGPVLVRLPSHFSRALDELPRAHARLLSA